MQSAKRATAISVWHVGCVAFTLALVSVPLNTPLQATAAAAVLSDAARADDLPAVRKLIKEHADVNAPAADGSSALLWAAYHSNVEMTKALLAAGAVADAANHYGAYPPSPGEPQRRRRSDAGVARGGSAADALARRGRDPADGRIAHRQGGRG